MSRTKRNNIVLKIYGYQKESYHKTIRRIYKYLIKKDINNPKNIDLPNEKTIINDYNYIDYIFKAKYFMDL